MYRTGLDGNLTLTEVRDAVVCVSELPFGWDAHAERGAARLRLSRCRWFARFPARGWLATSEPATDGVTRRDHACSVRRRSGRSVRESPHARGGLVNHRLANRPSAVVVMLGIPWDRTNQKIHVVLELTDDDGQPVIVPGQFGDTAVRVEADVEVGRPPGTPEGVNLEANLAPNIPPLPLAPGRYTWRLSLSPGDQVASKSFAVRI